MFNESGLCILEKQIETLFDNKTEYNNYKLIIKNISHTLLINHSKNDDDFIFKSFQSEKFKTLFLIRNNCILAGAFSPSSNTQYQRLLLIHIFIALINFKGDLFSIFKKFNESQEYDKNTYTNLKFFYHSKKSNLSYKETNDILEVLIFENYFLKSLINHFLKVFNEIFKKEDVNLKQIKLRNVYLLDVNSGKIILDMVKMQGGKGNKKNKKYYKYQKLLEEILYHSKNMCNSYIREYEMKFTTEQENFRFVKFECTSTYPRLLFIIKFIPILKGIAIIHLYSQKKLSRNNENNMQSEQGINYKEVDLLFGSFIRENPDLEFKYGAPKKLNYIEKFIQEFFITNRSDNGIFRLNNSDKKYKYVNYSAINIINSCQISSVDNIDDIFKDFNEKLKENYVEEKVDEKKSNNDSETKDLDKLFELKNKSLYSDIFDDFKNINMKNKMNGNIKGENEELISNDDSIKENNNNLNKGKDKDINENLNINNMMNLNSERKNLIDNDTLSLFNSKDDINIKNNISKLKFESSMISEIKKDQKYEIKIMNNQEQENKEETKREKEKENTQEKISDKSSINEKEYKFGDLLDLFSVNNEINSNKKEYNKIEKNDLSHKNIHTSKYSQNSLSRKKKEKLIMLDKSQDSGFRSSRKFLIKQ